VKLAVNRHLVNIPDTVSGVLGLAAFCSPVLRRPVELSDKQQETECDLDGRADVIGAECRKQLVVAGGQFRKQN
jgi:hypothetical protein